MEAAQRRLDRKVTKEVANKDRKVESDQKVAEAPAKPNRVLRKAWCCAGWRSLAQVWQGCCAVRKRSLARCCAGCAVHGAVQCVVQSAVAKSGKEFGTVQVAVWRQRAVQGAFRSPARLGAGKQQVCCWELHKQLDDGWPESVEEQGLLLLVWRHHITKQYIKDVL